jgi:HAMP domain-containing protein
LWREALDTGKAASGMAALSEDDPYYVHAVPVSPPDGPARVVEAGKPYEPTEETLDVLGTVLAAGIGAAFLLSIGGAYLLARAALRPIDAVARAAREIGESDLSKRLPVTNPKDEVGRLVATINGLLSRLEAAFARREEALERQRRFAADASHELRTPLTAISGHAGMLDGWALEEDPARAKQSVGVIRREAGRMRGLVESLLTLTRGDEGGGLEIGRHDLAAVAEEAAQAAREASGGRSKSSTSVPNKRSRPPSTGAVCLGSLHTLDNAVRYTPEVGGWWWECERKKSWSHSRFRTRASASRGSTAPRLRALLSGRPLPHRGRRGPGALHSPPDRRGPRRRDPGEEHAG